MGNSSYEGSFINMVAHQDMEFINIIKKQFMKVYGMMIHKIHLELKNGMIILIIKENIIMGKKMVLVFIFGLMVHIMKVNGLIII